MSKRSIKDQITDVEFAMEKNIGYSELLNIHYGILQILLSLDESEKKGRKTTINEEIIKNILEKTITTKRPMIDYVKTEDFDLEEILDKTMKILKLLIDNNEREELICLYKAIDNKILSIDRAINSVLKADAKWFNIISEKYRVEPSLLLLIFDSPLKPFFEHVARNVEDKIKETWWESYCPVCGRQPIVAKKRRMKKYMVCSYCGTEYLFDMFKCTNCGNNDPTSMGFLKLRKNDYYELDYCEVCKHYIKVLEEGSNITIPSGLEDILTRELDDIAAESMLDLKRN